MSRNKDSKNISMSNALANVMAKKFTYNEDTYEGNIELMRMALNLPENFPNRLELFNKAITNLESKFNQKISLEFISKLKLVDRNRGDHRVIYTKNFVKKADLHIKPMMWKYGFLQSIITSEAMNEEVNRLQIWKQRCFEDSVNPIGLQIIFPN